MYSFGMTSVRLEQITKNFGRTVALDGVTLAINAGELFFLLGPSGCGKTTLLRIIAGLHDPSAGRVFFNDQDVTNLGTEKRNAVMCFQSYALWPHLSVRENIRFGLEVRKVGRAEQDRRVDEALDLVKMREMGGRKPNELSGGQQQRVALARALVVRPRCLLLDEPLSNLDAKLRLEMRAEIRRICRAAGLTAVYVTHDQKEALSIADRMAVLNAGRIEQVGSPQEIYLRPNSAFIAHFMGETNFLSGTIVEAAAGRVMVRTAIGTLAGAAGAASFKAGQGVTVSIRPETIRLGSEHRAEKANQFDGSVHDTVYLGEVAQHQVSVRGANGGEVTLKVYELNPKFVARDQSVQPANISIDPGDVVVLAEEGAKG